MYSCTPLKYSVDPPSGIINQSYPSFIELFIKSYNIVSRHRTHDCRKKNATANCNTEEKKEM